MNKFKSTCKEDQGKSIVVSFHHKWMDNICSGKMSAFFRKRAPVNSNPENVYFYVGRPIMHIVASAKIISIEEVTLEESLLLCEAGQIGAQELTEYIGDNSVFAFKLSNIEIFANMIELSRLREVGGYLPPQSFSSYQIGAIQKLVV